MQFFSDVLPLQYNGKADDLRSDRIVLKVRLCAHYQRHGLFYPTTNSGRSQNNNNLYLQNPILFDLFQVSLAGIFSSFKPQCVFLVNLQSTHTNPKAKMRAQRYNFSLDVYFASCV